MERRGGWPLRDEDLLYLRLRTALAIAAAIAMGTGHFLLGGVLLAVALFALRRYSWYDAVLDPPCPRRWRIGGSRPRC